MVSAPRSLPSGNPNNEHMKYEEFENCGLKKSLDLLSGKWKPLILYHLFREYEVRFTDLWRTMPKVSKKVLLEQLKQMEDNKIVKRIEKNGFPPQVYYTLHEESRELGSILQALDNWGKRR